MEKRIKTIIEDLGHDVNTEGLIDTPQRITKHFKGFLKCITDKDRQEFMKTLTTFKATPDTGLIILKDIDFYSTCMHHALVFYGKVHIGYLPNKKIFGISKLARIVDFHSKTLHIQEELTKEITNTIVKAIKPFGVATIIEGIHLCMRARGVEKQNATMVTAQMYGRFRTSQNLRNEFLRLIGK